jgi:hypothetical protein
MNPMAAVTPEVRSLIEAVCDGVADDTQVRELESLLLTDENVCKSYVYMLDLDAKLQRLVGSFQESDAAVEEFITAAEAPPQRPAPTFPAAAWRGTFDYVSSGWPLAYLIATVVLSVGLLVAHLTSGSHSVQVTAKSPPGKTRTLAGHRMQFVGRITGMADCRWEKQGARDGGRGPEEGLRSKVQGSRLKSNQSVIPNPESLVCLGDKFALASGLMEVTYNTGAKVILQGPVTYEVEAKNGGLLSVGKLTCKVAAKSAKGFSVRTSTAIITDLGTEFGVEVNKDGNTVSHVFRGTVRVQTTGTDSRERDAAIILHENESVRVERSAGGVVVRRAYVDPHTFVQVVRPASTLDVLDILAGGDGRGNLRERGISPANGMEDPMFSEQEYASDGKYWRITWHPLIDGVFIPNGSTGPVTLDSAGHEFGGFPRTDGQSYGSIWARAVDVNLNLHRHRVEWMWRVNRAEQYMPEKRGLLCLGSNTGITFNLEAMRGKHQAVRPIRFRALAGLAAAEARWGNTDLGPADIWVFVDGQLKLKRMQLRPQDGVLPVDVKLGAQDRFLTLVSTDGGNGRAGDWVVFGDPILDMASTNENRP